MKYHLYTEIDIDAPPAIVWKVLTDVDSYADWNPFIVSSHSDGELVVGGQLINCLQQPGGKAMTFRPTVTELEPDRLFEWFGRMGLPRVFDGRHRFELEPLADGGTHLVQQEWLAGALVRPMRRSLDKKTLRGFELMNSALKTQAEAAISPGAPQR